MSINFRYTTDINDADATILGVNMNDGCSIGIEHVIIIATNDHTLLGGIAVIIYGDPTEERNPQCHYDQQAWIDHVVSKKKGIGRILVKAAKDWVLDRQHKLRRKNIYVGPCRSAEGFWFKCGFSKLFDPNALAHRVFVSIEDTSNSLDFVMINIAADDSVISYESSKKRQYDLIDLMEYTDCGRLMGMPLNTDFDQEVELENRNPK